MDEGTSGYYYDGNGNLVQILPPGATGQNPVNSLNYGYNQRNLMITNTLYISGTGWVAQADFDYDGMNNRLRQIDYTGATTTTITYTNDILGLSQVLVADDGTDQVVNLFGLDLIHQDEGTETRTLLADGLGSVRLEITDAGAETATTYSPYGETLTQSGTSGTAYGFTGEQEDDSTGLLYLRARYYSASLRSFMSKDPWSGNGQRPATLNGFSYISNNPVKLTDPLGLCEYDPYDPYIDYDCWVLAREISDWEGGGYAEFSTWDYEALSAYAYATGVGTGIIPASPSPWPNININAIQELKGTIIDSAKRHNDASRSNLSDEAFAALIAAHLNRESRFGAITWKRLTLYDAIGDIATRFLNYDGSIGIANIRVGVAEQILRGEIPGIPGCFDYEIYGSQIDPTQTGNFRDQIVNELFDRELSIEYLAANIERGVDRAEFFGLEPSVFNLGNWLWRGVQRPSVIQEELEDGDDVYRHGAALTKDMQKAFEVLGLPFTYYNAYNPDEAKFIK